MNKLYALLSICMMGFYGPLMICFSSSPAYNETDRVIVGIIAIFSALCFYVVLGVIVHKKNRSLINWIGLCILTSPVGFFFIHPAIIKVKTLEP